MKTIILCKKLFTAETDFAQENMAVILEDNKIADVVRRDEVGRPRQF